MSIALSAGKSQNEVKKILAGPDVFICDECIGLAVEALEDEGLPLGSADPDRHVYVQIPVPAQRSAVPTDARIGELLYLVGVDAEGRTDTVPVRLLRREPADDEGWVLLQLRCIKESAVAIAALIAGSRPFTILRVLGQPESDGLFARVTEAPSLPPLLEVSRAQSRLGPWSLGQRTLLPQYSSTEEAGVAKAKFVASIPERAVPRAEEPKEDKSSNGPTGSCSPDDTPPHGTARVEIAPKWSSA